MKLIDLPIDILSQIIVYLNVNCNKYIIYERYKNNDGSIFEMIKKIIYIPSKLCLINKKWYSAFLYCKCRACNTGKYDILRGKCINCCHILNGNKKRRFLKN